MMMALVRVKDHLFSDEWSGVLVASSRSNINPNRWAELELYKLDGDEGWLVHSVGRSLVYHRADTLCRTKRKVPPGEIVKPSDLPANAEPCYNCEPAYPERLERGEQIRWEIPNHKVSRFRTPRQVVKYLTTYRDGPSGIKVTRPSAPVKELVAQAIIKCPEFAEIVLPAETIEPVVTTDG
jgi:hypothetical protein